MNPEEKVMVVPAQSLAFRYRTDKVSDLLFNINKNIKYMRRGDVEHDYNYLQIIPYCVILDNATNNIFVTHRVSGGDDRLLNQYSLGTGGHIREPETIYNGILRELNEEVGLGFNEYDINVLGTIQSAITDVDRVHLAVVCIIEPEQSYISKIQCLEDELEGQWMTLDEIGAIYDKLESWSQIVYSAFREYNDTLIGD
jgi:predicted NUDIX family phosphoesterase